MKSAVTACLPACLPTCLPAPRTLPAEEPRLSYTAVQLVPTAHPQYLKYRVRVQQQQQYWKKNS